MGDREIEIAERGERDRGGVDVEAERAPDLGLELVTDRGPARVLVELAHEGVTRAGVEQPMAKADHAGLVRIGRDHEIVGEAPDEQALQAALPGVPPRDLFCGEVAAGGIDGANELNQLACLPGRCMHGEQPCRVPGA